MDLAIATRPVRPDDDERFRRLWPRLSRDTVYRRFHAPVHRLPPETVARLVRAQRQHVGPLDRQDPQVGAGQGEAALAGPARQRHRAGVVLGHAPPDGGEDTQVAAGGRVTQLAALEHHGRPEPIVAGGALPEQVRAPERPAGAASPRAQRASAPSATGVGGGASPTVAQAADRAVRQAMRWCRRMAALQAGGSSTVRAGARRRRNER